MRAKWQQLSEREQRLVLITAGVVLLSLLYFGLWQPLQQGIEAEQLRLQARQQTLQQLQQDAARVQQLRRHQAQSNRSATRKGSLLVVIERSAQQKKLQAALQKVQPEGKDGVRVWLDNAVFDDLVEWLDLLSRQHGLQISDISIERGTEPGRVNCRVLLRAA